MPDPKIALLIGLLITIGCLILVWPQGGLFRKWRRLRYLSNRILQEDALKHIQKAELKDLPTTLESVAGALEINKDHAAAMISEMEKMALVTCEDGQLQLTQPGRDYALHVIRAHRLWERYLAEETGFDESEWHLQADRYEHSLSPEEASSLSALLGHPTHDPHGDPIPTAQGEVVTHGGMPLTALEREQVGRIVHLEDEPQAIAAQLLAEGLYPGMMVYLTEKSQNRVRFWANGDEHLLAPLVAANISVMPLKRKTYQEDPKTAQLTILKPGEKGQVINISPRCRGPERRRMMDLGILPGTVITAEMRSPSGDPTAYRIRDALIGLRAEQAQLINIDRLPETP
jgi:DtxR family Mn-dependent transcriptional regulator